MNNDKNNNLNSAQDFIVEEKDIRFNSEAEQEKKTDDKLKAIKKPRKAKFVGSPLVVGKTIATHF